MLTVAVFSKVTSDVLGITVHGHRGQNRKIQLLTSVTFKTGSNQKNLRYRVFLSASQVTKIWRKANQ